ncbi:hypothetical protein [Nocardia brasiliensis]|uniref:hypothetical protein n=1 Tax=Nocardia brasiliensis TaxID=37326 RepID=UPI002455EC0E|nr:hypothetical protein [Nocardia brasiliensis]
MTAAGGSTLPGVDGAVDAGGAVAGAPVAMRDSDAADSTGPLGRPFPTALVPGAAPFEPCAALD